MLDKFAVVFPGQGSQSVGMLVELAQHYHEIVDTYSEASSVLGYDLWKLVKNGPAEELNQTEHTQPALLAGSYAIWRILTKNNHFKPVILAGHSLGEYSALVCSKAISFRDAVELVAARGKFMQEAVKPGEGGMAAIIGLSENIVNDLCAEAKSGKEILSPANFNSIGQIVIAGSKSAVDKAIVIAKQKGAKMVVPLPVSVPSHCDLMKPAAKKLKAMLDKVDIQIPDTSVINNADVKEYGDADSIRDGLTRQLYMPVRWVETVKAMLHLGVVNMIECGPGKVLSGLNKRIDKRIRMNATSHFKDLEQLIKKESAGN